MKKGVLIIVLTCLFSGIAYADQGIPPQFVGNNIIMKGKRTQLLNKCGSVKLIRKVPANVVQLNPADQQVLARPLTLSFFVRYPSYPQRADTGGLGKQQFNIKKEKVLQNTGDTVNIAYDNIDNTYRTAYVIKCSIDGNPVKCSDHIQLSTIKHNIPCIATPLMGVITLKARKEDLWGKATLHDFEYYKHRK